MRTSKARARAAAFTEGGDWAAVSGAECELVGGGQRPGRSKEMGGEVTVTVAQTWVAAWRR